MKKVFMPLAMAGVFIAGMSVASAGIIQPGMVDDFNDDTTMGWTNGARVTTPHPPHVEDGKLIVESFGLRFDEDEKEINDNKRLAFFNETYSHNRGKDEYTSPWEGDYSLIKTITADISATSSTVDNLYLRLAFTDGNNFFSSKNPFILATDGTEQKFSIGLDAANFETSSEYDDGETFDDVDESIFAEALKSVFGFKIISNEDDPIYGNSDVVAAKLTLDNFTATDQVSNVPLPGAAWLMISGLLSLGGLSSYKRRTAA